MQPVLLVSRGRQVVIRVLGSLTASCQQVGAALLLKTVLISCLFRAGAGAATVLFPAIGADGVEVF